MEPTPPVFEHCPPISLRDSRVGRGSGISETNHVVASTQVATDNTLTTEPWRSLLDQLRGTDLDEAHVLKAALDGFVSVLSPDLVSLNVRRGEHFVTVGAWPDGLLPEEACVLGDRGLLERALNRAEALLVENASRENGAVDSSSIAVALVGRTGILGAVYLERTASSPLFERRDLETAGLLSAAFARNLEILRLTRDQGRANCRMAAIFDALDDGVVITNESLLVESANEAARQLLMEPDLEGSDLREVLSHFELDIHPAAVVGVSRFHLHYRPRTARRRPGDSIAGAICNVTVRRVHEAGGNGGWVFCFHGGAVPSEAAQIQSFLRRRLTHDLVSRLTLLNNIAEIILENSEAPDDEDLRKLLKSSFESTQQWKEFLRRLVESKTSRRRVDPDRPWESNRIERLLDEALETHSDLVRRKGFHVLCDVPADASEMRGQRAHLRLVFQHLVHNAVRFGNTGGHLSVRARRVDRRTIVTFEDDGPGISGRSRELAELVVHQVEWPRPGGSLRDCSGLGLWIVHSVVEAHGGEVRVSSPRSEDGSGTLIELSFPTFPTVPPVPQPERKAR